MKSIIAISIITLGGAGCSSTDPSRSQAHLLPALRPYVNEVANELDTISADRKAVLAEIAANIAARLEKGADANVTFICTHNSRRSHMSQIWAQTAACYFGLDRVHAFSGGTEVTACNCRTVTAMRRAGFAIEDATTGDNPRYLVRYAEDRPPIQAYSKHYNADANPKRNFIALMTCSVADKSCPVVKGAISRYAIHYADPRLCDDTPTETAAYNDRCREIAREMFYIMSEVRRQMDGRHGSARSFRPASSLSDLAATISVLAAQRFGEKFGVQDSGGTRSIPTLASKS
jgi:hypothetical protein